MMNLGLLKWPRHLPPRQASINQHKVKLLPIPSIWPDRLTLLSSHQVGITQHTNYSAPTSLSRKRIVMFYSPRGHLWTSATRRSILQLREQQRLRQRNPFGPSYQARAAKSLSGRKQGKCQDVPKICLSNTPRIADIVMGIEDCGVVIEHGRLRITSSKRSRQDHRTALVLSGTSQSLTAYDICRTLKSEGNLEGLEEVLPIRNHQTLQRCDAWVLVFISPAHAMACQQRVVELQELWSRQVATAGTIASIMPTEASFANGRANQTKLFNYALTSTLQNVSVTAQLFPFDSKLQRAIRIHRGLYQAGSSGNQFFPVRLHLDHPTIPVLDSHYLRKLLKLDGIMRGRRWALPENDDAIIRVEPMTVHGLSQVNLGVSECDSVTNIPIMWRINFLTAFDATRFVRIWHHKSLPLLGNIDIDECSLYVKAECIF